jgi:formamidopyrimidine-DNA glycosylase
MPELPDIEAYRTSLSTVLAGQNLHWLRIHHPFLLRSVLVDPQAATGSSISDVKRLGKRIVLCFENGVSLVFHLMIAGRFAWRASEAPPPDPGVRRPGKSGPLLQMGFENGELRLTEAGSRRRASLHVVDSANGLAALDPGGLEVLDPPVSLAEFTSQIGKSNHTVKRALTDPHIFSGIGNAYSDEILFAARISPFARTGSLDDEALRRLHDAMITTLGEWRDRLVAKARQAFPKKVTAFRPEMHVHGKYGEPCTRCGTPVQRIRYAENECNYCAECQTGGKIFADRALSRLLKDDWPRTIEELEQLPGRTTSR